MANGMLVLARQALVVGSFYRLSQRKRSQAERKKANDLFSCFTVQDLGYRVLDLGVWREGLGVEHVGQSVSECPKLLEPQAFHGARVVGD